MKKNTSKQHLINRIIALIIIFLSGTYLEVKAGLQFLYEYEGQTLSYYGNDADKTCYIDELNSVSGKLVIPSKVVYEGEEYIVTGIRQRAFQNCSNLETVEIGDSVKTIGKDAFNGCAGLTSVIIGNSVKTIGEHAFCDCSSLTSVIIGHSVETILLSAFYNCNNLTSVYIDDLKNWCNIEFQGASSNPLNNGAYLYVDGKMLINLTLPEEITTLKDYTFYNCRSLMNVDLPASIIDIGLRTFSYCYALSNINFSKCYSLKSIGSYAFDSCQSLSAVDLSNCLSLISLNSGVFMECINLQSVDLSGCNNLQSIGDWSFENCGNMTCINMSNLQKLTSIGKSAFEYCEELNSIDLTGCESLSSIGEYAFKGCKKIEEVKCAKIEDWLKINFEDLYANPLCLSEAQLLIDNVCLEHLKIPATIQHIKSKAFYEYRWLKSVEFNQGLIGIGERAFCNATNISQLDFDKCNNLECIDWDAFSGIDSLIEVNLSGCKNLKTIGTDVFAGCHNLKFVELPESLKKFKSDYAYVGAFALSKLKHVICHAVEPPVCEYNIFLNSPMKTEGTLFVPGEYLILYKNSKGWQDAKNILPLDEYVKVESVWLGETLIHLEVGNTTKLSLFPYPENAIMILDVEWESLDSDIASVSADGVVYAKSSGETIIRGRYGEYSAECKVRVGNTVEEIPVNKIELSKDHLALTVNDTAVLSAEIYPHNATNIHLIWASVNPDIATVDEEGNVAAIAPGTTLIRIYSESNPEVYAECHVTVKANVIEVKDIMIDPREWTAEIGDEINLGVTVLPEEATDSAIIWESENPEIAVVDETGHVKAVGAGETVIRATSVSNHEVYGECRVTVISRVVAVEELVINPHEWVAEIGDEINLEATVLPEEATDSAIIWESENPEIAVVDETGHVKAVGAGETVIRAISVSNHEVYGECHVTVKELNDHSELVWDQTFRCAVGETVELSAYSSAGLPLTYISIKPDGGFCEADIYNQDDRNFVTFNYEGAYVLEVSDGINSIEKRFNVLGSHEGLMYEDGIYYRYKTDDRSSLMVVRGYEMYEGNYTIPAITFGLPVVSIDNFAFYSCRSLNDVIIEDGIQTIGAQAFGNGTLHSIAIPSSVKKLTDFVFNALCGDLMSISLHGLTPPYADETTFNGFVDYEKCILHIPEGTISVYKEAPIWQSFVNIVDDLSRLTSIEIQGGALNLTIGQKLTLRAILTPSDANDDIYWESSDPTIVSIDESGTISCLAEGVAEITATAGDVSDSITVTVDNLTSVQEIEYGNVSVSSSGKEIIITGMPIGGVVSLINIDGTITRNIISDSSELRISVGIKGVYLLKIANRTFKVLIK